MSKANDYQFELVYDVISDIVFEHIQFSEVAILEIVKYFRKRMQKFPNVEYDIFFDFVKKVCVITVQIADDKRQYDLMRYLK